MKKFFEAPEITKLSLVTEEVALTLQDGIKNDVEITSGDINDIPEF